MDIQSIINRKAKLRKELEELEAKLDNVKLEPNTILYNDTQAIIVNEQDGVYCKITPIVLAYIGNGWDNRTITCRVSEIVTQFPHKVELPKELIPLHEYQKGKTYGE